MTRHLRLPSIVISLLLLSASWANAQFQLDIEHQATLKPEEEDYILEEKPQQHGRNQFAVQQNIDAWIFNQHGNARQARIALERQLQAKLQAFGDQFELSKPQKSKLEIAGTRDITSYFMDVEQIRSEFDDQVDQKQFAQVWQRVQPLQLRMQRGLFSNDSMLHKVIRRTLNDQQLTEHEKKEQERIDFAYRAAIRLAISELEKSAPLRNEQREKIIGLLDKTDSPKVLGQYTNYYVLYCLSQHEKEVKNILRRSQHKAWTQALNQGQGMGQFLKQNGIID